MSQILKLLFCHIDTFISLKNHAPTANNNKIYFPLKDFEIYETPYGIETRLHDSRGKHIQQLITLTSQWH